MQKVRFFLAFLLGASCVYAQPVDSVSRFESVTINPGNFQPAEAAGSPIGLDGCTGGPGSAEPEHLKCNVTLGTLLILAYQLEPLQFTPPDWMQGSWWTVEATIPTGATREQLRAMERNLLADRFKLKVHFAKKVVQAYEMTVGSGGPKFGVWDSKVSSVPPPRSYSADASGVTIQVFPNRQSPYFTADCAGNWRVRIAASMRDLAATLSWILRISVTDSNPVSVFDATGLKDVYEITLEFKGLPEQSVACGNCRSKELCPTPAPSPRSNLLEAVHKQLGLDLELTRNMVDMLVIDHIDRTPSKK